MNVGTARRILFALCLPLAGIAANAQSAPTTVHSLPKPVAVSPKVITNYGKLPLSFEPNVGQTSKQVQWLARGSQYTLFLAGHDAVLELNKITSAKRGKAEQPKISSSALRMNLLGTAAPERASGEETLPGKVNYFTGKDPSKWQRDVPTYGKVRMPGVYPGIDLAYYGHQGRLEYDFVVAPGANASAIQLRFDGAKAKIVANGDLVLPLAGADPVRFGKPVVYQMKNGVRQPVDGSFMIAKNQQVSFRVGAYDKSRELIIDPTLIFAGTLGTGNGQTVAEGMAVDAAGEIFLTGVTQDLTFPTTSGALQMTCPAMSPPSAANGITRCGTNDGTLTSGFVTKISADGTSLVYSTYLHGVSGGESGKSVAVDAAGDAYVLGATTSNDFPVTADAINNFCLPAYAMNGCCTITTTVYSTCDGYFAGGGTEWVVGGPSLFISKLNPSGSALLYSTFFGGTDATYPVGLALDSSNNIYFSGYDQNARPASNIYPNSNAIQYPVTASGYQQVGVGMQAATLSELSADGHTLLYSTFLGTLATNSFFAYTNPLAMALGPNGMAYVGGYTLASGYPTTPGSVRPACVENATTPANCEAYTGFVSAIDTTQSGAASLAYSTFIGGTEVPGANSVQTEVNALAADNSNNLYVAGYTSTIDYPTTAGAYQPTCGHANAANQCSQAFVSKINPPGSAYVWSTYYGGTSSNPPSTSASGVTVDAAGRVYLYGLSSGGGDVPQVNPVQPWYGNDEIFIATLSADAKQLLFGTYFGNPQTVVANASQPIANNGIGLDAAGNIYFAGYTNAGVNWASSTPDTYATPITGGSDLTFFGKISPVLALNTTTLTITPSTTTTGQIVTFTATVAGTTLITPAPTGTVTLTNGNTAPPTVLGTITLDNGTGTFTTSSLPAGTYSVTASYSGDSTYDVSASSAMPLTITTPATLVSIAVTPSSPSIAKGLTQQFTATGTYSDSSTQNITSTVTWASATTTTATITTGGLATGVGAGTSIITATLNGITSPNDTLTVTAATLVSIAVTPSSPSIAKGLTQQFTATGTYSDSSTQNITSTVTWASATTTTATITTGGLATGVGAGTSIITATLNGITSPNDTLTVTAATLVSIAVTPSSPSIAKGLTQQFTATGTYSDSSTQNITSTVTWASATTTTATITTGGLATGVGAGTSIITATLNGITSPNDTLTVTAATLVSIAVTPSSPSIAKGLTQQFTATGTYSDSSTQNITSTVTWASATTTTASITTGGLAIGVGVGTSNITATLGSVVSPADTLTVTAATLVSIAVTPSSPSIAKGLTQQFTATGTYSDSSTQNITSTVTWASATTTTASITTGGLATGVGAGTSIITAKLNGITSPNDTLTVTAANGAGNFTITADPPAETIKRGVLGGFILQLKSVNGFNGNVTLSCSGGPAGSICEDLPMTVKVNGTAYAVSGILFPKNAKPGTYIITFTGVSGSLTNTATAKFTVE